MRSLQESEDAPEEAEVSARLEAIISAGGGEAALVRVLSARWAALALRGEGAADQQRVSFERVPNSSPNALKTPPVCILRRLKLRSTAARSTCAVHALWR